MTRWRRCGVRRESSRPLCVAVWIGRGILCALTLCALVWLAALSRRWSPFSSFTASTTVGANTNPLAAAAQQRFWEYRDPTGVVRGPFPTSQMRHWHMQNLLSEDLPVRIAGTSEAFTTLQSMFRNNADAFTSGGTASSAAASVVSTGSSSSSSSSSLALRGAPHLSQMVQPALPPLAPRTAPPSHPPTSTMTQLPPIELAPDRTLEAIRRGTLFVLQLHRARPKTLRHATGTWRYGERRRRRRGSNASGAEGFSPACNAAAFDRGKQLIDVCADLTLNPAACEQRGDLLRYARVVKTALAADGERVSQALTPSSRDVHGLPVKPRVDCITGVNSLAYTSRFNDELLPHQRAALTTWFEAARIVSGRFSFGVHTIGHRKGGEFLYVTLLVDPTVRAVDEWLVWRRRIRKARCGATVYGPNGGAAADAAASSTDVIETEASLGIFVQRVGGSNVGAAPLRVQLQRDACPNHQVRTLCGDHRVTGGEDVLDENEGGSCVIVTQIELDCAKRNLATFFLVLTDDAINARRNSDVNELILTTVIGAPLSAENDDVPEDVMWRRELSEAREWLAEAREFGKDAAALALLQTLNELDAALYVCYIFIISYD